MTDRTYIHQHPYRGFIVATFADNGKPVGEFGDVPILARYYVLDEFEQNVIPHDQWHWSAVDAFAAIDAICIANPKCEPTKWKGVYDRLAEYRRLQRLTPYCIEVLDKLRSAAADWTFNSGEDCEADVKRIVGPLFSQLDKVGPTPAEMF